MEKERAGLLQNMRQSLEKVDLQALRCYTKRVAELGIDPVVAIRYGLMDGMCALSEAFDEGEIFIPQLLLAAEAVEEAAHILSRQIAASDRRNMPKGKVLIYVVEGDIHDIGKNIVKALLENYGYRVVDLGKDVPVETVVAAVQKYEAGLVGLSALMTTTVTAMEATIAALQKQKQPCKILVGGAVLTEEYAAQIKADAYAPNAIAAVNYANSLFKKDEVH